MKNIISIIIVFFCIQASAQYIIPVEQFYNYDHTNVMNHYFKDVNGVFDKFLGDWKYETSTDKVEITIYKFEDDDDHGMMYLEDEIYIEFKYTQNGVVIYNTFGANKSNWIFGLYFKYPTNTDKYHLMYQEPGQDRRSMPQYLDIEYIPNTTGGQPQLNWSIYTELSAADGEDVPKIPLNMVFTKLP
jgi:hypothetical protein